MKQERRKKRALGHSTCNVIILLLLLYHFKAFPLFHNVIICVKISNGLWYQRDQRPCWRGPERYLVCELEGGHLYSGCNVINEV